MSVEVRPVDDDGTWNGYLEHAATPTAFRFSSGTSPTHFRRQHP